MHQEGFSKIFLVTAIAGLLLFIVFIKIIISSEQFFSCSRELGSSPKLDCTGILIYPWKWNKVYPIGYEQVCLGIHECTHGSLRNLNIKINFSPEEKYEIVNFVGTITEGKNYCIEDECVVTVDGKPITVSINEKLFKVGEKVSVKAVKAKYGLFVIEPYCADCYIKE